MQISILVPFQDHAWILPTFLKAAEKVEKYSHSVEWIFIDHASVDQSLAILEKWKGAKKIVKGKSNIAESLNLAVEQARGEIFLFLRPNCLPQHDWVKEMCSSSSGYAVGATKPALRDRRNPFAVLSAKLFTDYSKRTSQAIGHALPWGPGNNLGITRENWKKIGKFSAAADGAFDIDWGWRAILQGVRPDFLENAVVREAHRGDRNELLHQFERFGFGEAWLHRTYSFLLATEDQFPDSLISALNAFERLRYHSQISEDTRFEKLLEEISVAFALGVRVGYEVPLKKCPLPREMPERTVWWKTEKSTATLFVPGKGVTEINGKVLQLFEFWQSGATEHELVHRFMRLFGASHEEAHHEVESLMEALSP